MDIYLADNVRDHDYVP